MASPMGRRHSTFAIVSKESSPKGWIPISRRRLARIQVYVEPVATGSTHPPSPCGSREGHPRVYLAHSGPSSHPKTKYTAQYMYATPRRGGFGNRLGKRTKPIEPSLHPERRTHREAFEPPDCARRGHGDRGHGLPDAKGRDDARRWFLCLRRPFGVRPPDPRPSPLRIELLILSELVTSWGLGQR